jgi:hypothetical protein
MNPITDAETKWLLSYWNISTCVPNGEYYMINIEKNPNSTVKNKKSFRSAWH